MPPTPPYLITVIVKDIYSILLEGATVTITHVNGTKTGTTGSDGQVILNLSSLSSWAVGDSLSIKANKTAEGTKTITTTILGGGGQTENITLAETSDFDFETQSSLADRYPFSMIMPVHYDGEKVTRERPLPVLTEHPLEKYQLTDQDVSGNPQYYGFTDRFGNWYIRQDDNSLGTFRYFKGNSDYITNWTNRATLSYNYFYNIF